MEVNVNPTILSGTIAAIPSKSQAHRALICAALADAPTFIECAGESQDISATAECLSALGAKIERTTQGYSVSPIPRHCTNDSSRTTPSCTSSDNLDNSLPCDDDFLHSHISCMDGIVVPQGHVQSGVPTLACGESGSTLRFMLPVVGALGRSAAFMPQGRLPERPLSPLDAQLVAHGMMLSPKGSVPFLADGRLSPGRYELDGGVSSQFVSGLLFALPLLDGDSELHLTGNVESFPYIELTLDMLEAFGVKIAFDGASFSIKGGQIYRSPKALNVEGDWSNAAFWLCAGALSPSGITVSQLNSNSRQGDRAIIEILKRFGANVTINTNSVTISRGAIKPLDIDAADIPDLVPVLCALAAAAKGVTTVRNAARLRIKESDRLSAVASVLTKLGAKVAETHDTLTIQSDGLSGGKVHSYGDHRIAMSVAIAALSCAEPVVISGAETVRKSYPRFFEDWASLGGTLGTLPG